MWMTSARKNRAQTCDHCGGRSFRPRYQTSTKVKFGFAALAGPPMHVECVKCGALQTRRH